MRPEWRRRLGISAVALVVLFFLGLGLASYREWPASRVAQPLTVGTTQTGDVAKLEATLDALRPRGVFLTVDTVANRLQVRRGGEILREAVCSTGTGSVLEDPRTGKRWVFETPRGIRTVRAKRRDPVWVRPDWSFIEEGSQPPARLADRLDQDTLGDWALDLGDGYMIHGTLFQRYLGRNVTHGCIRVGDDDLNYVSEMVKVGTTVLLF